jgi:hypothetical protein
VTRCRIDTARHEWHPVAQDYYSGLSGCRELVKPSKDEEDDEETKALDAKVERTLRDIAETSASIPDVLSYFSGLIQKEYDEAKAKGLEFQPDKLLEVLKQLMKYVPDLTAVLNNYTGTLAAYAQHRALIKQERIANKVLRENRNLTKVTAILAVSTIVLAIATITLALHI